MIKFPKICYLLILPFFCCTKLYNPPAKAAHNSFLVVEGVINSGSDSTIVRLSGTVNTNAGSILNPVLGASVTVEAERGGVWPLNGDGTGRYVSVTQYLPISQKYRLRIITGNGVQYLSDFVPVLLTPPIDSIGYNVKNGGLQLYVNAHGAAGDSRYYRWDYNETWAFNSKYGSSRRVDTLAHTVVIRMPDQLVYSCFGNDVSANILLSTTSGLISNVVYQSPLTNIPLTSEKLESRYSILVRQYALTADAHQFYAILKKNSEQLGGIFGPLPSELTGNIHCISDTGKIAIGYVSATNVQSKRIFISHSALPPGTEAIYPYGCTLDSVSSAEFFVTPPYEYTPIDLIHYGYLYSSKECVDCTSRGSTQTPSFWK
jgi:hypothetical protein